MFRSVVIAAVLLVGLSACGDPSADPGGGAGGGAGAGENTTSGTFTVYTSGVNAVTYDEALVPVGATAAVTVEKAEGGTTVLLAVTGLKSQRAFGAHLHTRPCGSAPADSGSHLQHSQAPVPPVPPSASSSVSPLSVDPAYANPANEVWLDFTTDAAGAARSTATLNWTFDPEPGSLVIHAQPTKTGPGEAGTAGPRAACLSLP